MSSAKEAREKLEEQKRHNKAMETPVALGRGLFIRPYRRGFGLYVKPYQKKGKGLYVKAYPKTGKGLYVRPYPKKNDESLYHAEP